MIHVRVGIGGTGECKPRASGDDPHLAYGIPEVQE